MEGEKLNRKGENVKSGNGIGQMLFFYLSVFSLFFTPKMKVLSPNQQRTNLADVVGCSPKNEVLPPNFRLSIKYEVGYSPKNEGVTTRASLCHR